MSQRDEELSLKLFVVLTRALDTIKKRVSENIRDLGLNPTEYAVLEFIYNKGEQPIQKIGEKVLIASSSITYVVDQLEKKEYLQRKPHPTDRRVTITSLTDSGKELMDDLFPKNKARIQEIMSALDEEEKATVVELLKKLGLGAMHR